jgi:hypothetical protein
MPRGSTQVASASVKLPLLATLPDQLAESTLVAASGAAGGGVELTSPMGARSVHRDVRSIGRRT